MSHLHADRIETAVREVLEGSLGQVRTVSSGVFQSGVFDGQPTPAKIAKAIQRSNAKHWFDVDIGSFSDHESTNVGALSSRRIIEAPITVRLWSKLDTRPESSARRTLLSDIASDCEDAVQALSYRHNLAQTSGGLDTEIIGGLLHGPDGLAGPMWQKLDENWTDGLLESEIRGSVVVTIKQSPIE